MRDDDRSRREWARMSEDDDRDDRPGQNLPGNFGFDRGGEGFPGGSYFGGGDRGRDRMGDYAGHGHMGGGDVPGYGPARYGDVGRGVDAGYRGGGFLGGSYSGGMRYPAPHRGQSGPMAQPGAPRSFRGVGPKNYRRSDDAIREDLCELLMDDPDVDATEIDVRVSEGVVTLDGTVRDRSMKHLAERLAESVRGVRDVQNNLQKG